LACVIHGEKRGRAANMAQERGEKRPDSPDFDQTQGEPEVETGHYLRAYFSNVRCLA
jgi:hypothetical protein